MSQALEILFGQTRGRILWLLRHRAQTVNDLAASLELTDNAVRAQLADLQNQELVISPGQQPGSRKPHVLYALTPKAHEMMSRLYVPVLTTLLELLSERLPAAQVDALMRGVGKRLAQPHEDELSRLSLARRIENAIQLLADLGADATATKEAGQWVIRGQGCPLSSVVSKDPNSCHLLESLLTDLLGQPVRESCTKGLNPQCCFRISA